MSIILDIVADYNKDVSDLAFIEVKNKFYELFNMQNLYISHSSTMPFNTIENALITSQIALNSNLGKRHIVFHNVAPRKDNKSERVDNDGEKLAFSILPNNVLVVGVLSGYSFSFINEISKVYISKCPTSGSQFRSRDIFPNYTKIIFEKYIRNEDMSDIIESEIQIGELKKVENNTVVYVDGYGNIKLYGNFSNIEKDFLEIEINNIKAIAKFKDKNGIFSVKDGDLVLSKGSSGWSINGHVKEFYEIVLRGGSASSIFNGVKPGDFIKFS